MLLIITEQSVLVKLRTLRGLLGKSQKELADQIPVSQAFFSMVENEKRCASERFRKRLSVILNVSSEEIFGDE
jgi:transcriptional regulator with XRE-family HTH domain